MAPVLLGGGPPPSAKYVSRNPLLSPDYALCPLYIFILKRPKNIYEGRVECLVSLSLPLDATKVRPVLIVGWVPLSLLNKKNLIYLDSETFDLRSLLSSLIPPFFLWVFLNLYLILLFGPPLRSSSDKFISPSFLWPLPQKILVFLWLFFFITIFWVYIIIYYALIMMII